MRLPAPASLRLMAYAPSAKLRRTCPPGTRIASVRRRTLSDGSTLTSPSPVRCSRAQDQMFSTAARVHWPYKDDQDKDSVAPKDGSGYDPSGTDSAFDPGQTSPEEQGSNVEKESGTGGEKDEGGRLGNSPTNAGASQGKGNKTEHAGEGDRARTSGAGSAPKSGS